MPLGIKLRVNMSYESSKLENVVFQLIPVSSITHNHTRTSSPRLFKDIWGNKIVDKSWQDMVLTNVPRPIQIPVVQCPTTESQMIL